jgi:predicted nucleic acid-binding protein
MNQPKQLVLDANILIRAAHGLQVRTILQTYADSTALCTPDVCFEDAKRHISLIARNRNLDPETGLAVLGWIGGVIEIVERGLYEKYKPLAEQRISKRDPDDWPIVATAMLLNAPIWTEDRDFFGCGIATWTSDRDEIYLRGN